MVTNPRIAAGSTVVSYWLRLLRCTKDKKHHEDRLLSRDRKSSEQFTYCKRRDHEIKAELALSGIMPSMMSNANQEEAI